MLKKTLLKNTTRFLEKPFPENLFPYKKVNRKRKFLFYSSKRDFLKIKLFYTNFKTFKFKNKKKFLFPLCMIKAKLEKIPRKTSDFKKILKEIKKVSLLYGNLNYTEIKKALHSAKKLRNNDSENFCCILESRLDVILYRSLFFSSIQFARQWIRSNEVLVNSKCVNIASYKLKPGDIISMKYKNKKFLGKNILKYLVYNTNHSGSTPNLADSFLKKPKFQVSQLNLKKKHIEKNSKQVELNTSLKLSPYSSVISEILKWKSVKKIFLLHYRCTETVCEMVLPETTFHPEYISFVYKKLKNLKSKIKNLCSKKRLNESFTLLLHSIVYTHNSFISRIHDHKLVSSEKLNPTLLLNDKFTKIFHGFQFSGFKNISKFIHNKTQFETFNTLSENFNFIMVKEKPQNSFSANNTMDHTHQASKEFLQNPSTTQRNAYTYLEKIFKTRKLRFILNKLTRNSIVNTTIYTNINTVLFKKKYRYVISNFYLKQLQNQISPLNVFLLKHSVNMNLKKNKKLAVLLIHLNNLLMNTTKNIISSVLDYSDKYFSYQEKKCLKNSVKTLYYPKQYDIFTFLKLKTLFFYKRTREIQTSTNSSMKLAFYKPLNLEISYKTLTIIYLYPSQKLVFPCTLDVQLLLRHTS